MSRFVVGTVRGRRGRVHLVVTGSGERIEFTFDGPPPAIGADVIGVVEEMDGKASMRIVPDIVDELLRGRSLISTSGRPDVTARMLASVLSRAGPAAIALGTGGVIDRTPRMDDVDAGWAFDLLSQEARNVGIALNVVSPLPVSDMEWSDANLVQDLLPADATGERDALRSLRNVFLSGLSPTCRRTILALGRGAPTPSVDFIVPYSPFVGGIGFSNRLASARRDEMVKVPMSLGSSRRFSSAREMALAFTSRHLGRARPGDAFHETREEVFADVVAVLLMLAHGNEDDRHGAHALLSLREAALARWNGRGRAPVPSHAAIAQALLPGVADPDAPISHVLRDAADIARSLAPSDDDALRALAGSSGSDHFFPLRHMTERRRKALEEHYVSDLREIVSLLPGEASFDRFDRFASLDVPEGFETIHHDTLAPARAHVDPASTYDDGGILFADDPWAMADHEEDRTAAPSP